VANSPQARKRARQALKRRLHNLSQKSEMRTALKKVLKAVENKDLEAARASFKVATKEIDTLAGRNVIHTNKADRLKSRLNAKVKALTATA
jgi:small subunit ribosomal protein S20